MQRPTRPAHARTARLNHHGQRTPLGLLGFLAVLGSAAGLAVAPSLAAVVALAVGVAGLVARGRSA